ncbi:MAG: hypothetical protein K8I30_11875, partial [Anaerolineae bacterium]|nr:hypothetical protein [Anaerolineae bacterium]
LELVRGSVRNDSTFTLQSPVIMTRGVTLQLAEPLAPGDVQTFDLVIANENEPAAPSPLERSASVPTVRLGFQRFSSDTRYTEQTVIDIMGDTLYDYRAYTSPPGSDPTVQNNRRRQLFVSSFNNDPYLSTARGGRVFLAGWSDEMPLTTDLVGGSSETVDTTLHLIELAVDQRSMSGEALISGSQFTWVAQARNGLTTEIAPVNTVMQPGDEVVFRFNPIEGSVLSEVESLRVIFDTAGSARAGTPMQLWDWQRQQWIEIELSPLTETMSISDYVDRRPARFLGPNNAVQMRLVADDSGGYVRIERISIEQQGRF